MVGHNHATRTGELVRALRSRGVSCAERLTRFTEAREPQGVALVRCHFPYGKWRHWQIWERGIVLDPAGDVHDWRPTSFLELNLPEG